MIKVTFLSGYRLESFSLASRHCRNAAICKKNNFAVFFREKNSRNSHWGTGTLRRFGFPVYPQPVWIRPR